MNECLHLTAYLALSGASNGVGLWCADCERWVTKAKGHHTSWALPKSHALLDGVNRAHLPRVHPVAVECEVCEQSTQTPELHHWCPQALYKDIPIPNNGPQAWLCTTCHATWHEIVTPMLRGGVTRDRCVAFLRGMFRRMKPHEWRMFVVAVNDADAKVRARVPHTPARTEDAA